MAKDFNKFLELLDSGEAYNEEFDTARKNVQHIDSTIVLETTRGRDFVPTEDKIKAAYDAGKAVSIYHLRMYHEWINS